ncbi:hypothetical protein OG819_54880 [Streptomyces sp. NBC_01549]|uniref:hypothetical protein n=1 Tax=Streptomyces sp. NBC_01549 TaxID=2975874 RepID=UPI002251C656|nr:hypothetical protein [Streptomyces sp. NBC_01549]MCX4598244.1 hypothetical protein [Streptomyces sp. NBC_01549]
MPRSPRPSQRLRVPVPGRRPSPGGNTIASALASLPNTYTLAASPAVAIGYVAACMAAALIG